MINEIFTSIIFSVNVTIIKPSTTIMESRKTVRLFPYFLFKKNPKGNPTVEKMTYKINGREEKRVSPETFSTSWMKKGKLDKSALTT